MNEQKQIQKQQASQKREREVVEALPGGAEQVAQAEAKLQAMRDAVDDVLSQFLPLARPTEIIGPTLSQQRPSLRQNSSEEFIRAFRQQGGQ